MPPPVSSMPGRIKLSEDTDVTVRMVELTPPVPAVKYAPSLFQFKPSVDVLMVQGILLLLVYCPPMTQRSFVPMLYAPA